MDSILCEEFLHLIDIFGFNLNFRNKEFLQYRTKLGGFLTIFYGFLCLLFFFYSSQDIFYQTNPKVRQSVEYKENVVIESPEFIFSLYFSDSELNLLKFTEDKDINDYFEFWATVKTKSFIKSEDRELKVEFKRCNKTINKVIFENTFFTKQSHFINEEKINNTYCLELENFQLQNALNEIPKKSLSLYVKRKVPNERSKIKNIFIQ